MFRLDALSVFALVVIVMHVSVFRRVFNRVCVIRRVLCHSVSPPFVIEGRESYHHNYLRANREALEERLSLKSAAFDDQSRGPYLAR